MDSVLGNGRLLRTLFSDIQNNRVSGCYLIEGAKGTGKFYVAESFAAALSCTAFQKNGTPCMSCTACRNVFSGGHADVHILRAKEDETFISVDSVREFLQNSYVLPSQGEWRIFIIDECERMRKEAQNALLKSIEEPREQTVFFLLTEDKTRLLPTVRSRAVHYKTDPLPNAEIQHRLLKRGLSQERAEEAALLSGGSWGKACQIADDESIHETRKKVSEYFQALFRRDGFTKLCLIFPPRTITRKELSIILPMVKSALRDLISFHYGFSDSVLFFFDQEFLEDFAAILSPNAALKLYEATQELEFSLEQNANLFTTISAFHLKAQKLTQTD